MTTYPSGIISSCLNLRHPPILDIQCQHLSEVLIPLVFVAKITNDPNFIIHQSGSMLICSGKIGQWVNEILKLPVVINYTNIVINKKIWII